MDEVYVANFGEANALWPIALSHDTILTIDNVAVHDFWRAADRAGFIEKALTQTVTARGERPTRQTAGRWYNLIDELRDSEGDIWINRQGDALWWTRSLEGQLAGSLIDSTNPKRDGAEVWLLEKPCLPWRDRDLSGRPLRWSGLHAKTRDFLSTEATFQRLGNDRGYADYATALVEGQPLERWLNSPPFAKKQAATKNQNVRYLTPRELAAARMAYTIMDTVSGANGQVVERRVKKKLASLDREEWQKLLREKMGEQEDRCALTGLPLGYDQECDDKEMWVSVDRIDSSAHYTPDNIQLVCRFINRWKGADEDVLVRRLLDSLRGEISIVEAEVTV